MVTSKWILLSVLINLFCTECDAVHYDISVTCSREVTSSAVYPCYSLQHFCDNQELLSGNGSVKLFFMSGVHQVNNCTISASSLEKLELLPRNVQEKVEIEQAKFVLTSINDLVIISLKFTACSFQYYAYIKRGINDNYNQMNVANCTFTLSRECAIIINTVTKANISLHNCIFSSNEAGGLCKTELYSKHSIISIYDSLFKNNSAIGYYSSSIYVYQVAMNIQRSQFVSCKSHSGTVSARWSSVLIEDSIFENNIATGSGNLHSEDSNVTISNCSFENNLSFDKGGAIYLKIRTIIIKGSTFRNNSALDSGGAIYFEIPSVTSKVSNCVFQDNYANYSGGAIYTELLIERKLFMTNISYIHNRAGKHGGAAAHNYTYFSRSQIYYTGLKAVSNEAERGGAFYLSRIAFNVREKHNSSAESDALFANNKASLEGGAIHASDSVINVSEHAVVIVENNTAGNEGGGWYISTSSIKILANILIAFRHNVVTNTSHGRGGAIFYNDEAICQIKNYVYTISTQCFLMGNSSIGKVFEFTDNTASSGSVLYGGLLDVCRTDSGLGKINFFRQISHYRPSPKAISSDPARLCWCF